MDALSSEAPIALALTAALVFARVAGLAWTAPVWGLPALGWRVRVGLALFLTALLLPLVQLADGRETTVAAWAGPLAFELVGGLAMGMAVSLVLSAARQAGDWIGQLGGLSAASLMGPEGAQTGGEPSTALGHLYGLIALASFLAVNGPLRLVDALLESFQALPPGTLAGSLAQVERAFEALNAAFALTLQVAAPVLAAQILGMVALALLARGASGLGLFQVVLPGRWLITILLCLAGVSVVGITLARAWNVSPSLAIRILG